jgi:hypothetical protein
MHFLANKCKRNKMQGANPTIFEFTTTTPVLVFCSKKNLATLPTSVGRSKKNGSSVGLASKF